MIILIIAILALIAMIVFLILGHRANSSFDFGLYMGAFIAGSILFYIGLSQIYDYTTYLERLEIVKTEKQVLTNLGTKKTEVLKEFKSYLAIRYPAQEKEIYEAITKGNQQYLWNLPGFRADRTMTDYADNVKTIEQEIQDTKAKYIDIKTSLRYMSHNPFSMVQIFFEPYNEI